MLDRRPFVIGTSATKLQAPSHAYREQYKSRRSFLCENAFDSAFLAALLDLCDRGSFAPDSVEGLGDREVERPQRAGGAITLALRRANLMRWLEGATGCGQLTTADGRVIQARANNHDQLVWHNDLNEPLRRIGVTIGLSDAPYEGGMFELRHARTKKVLVSYRHDVAGTALIFDVSPDLEHRVLPITAGGRRRVYTGWFFRRDAA
jgi:hypothetical protein